MAQIRVKDAADIHRIRRETECRTEKMPLETELTQFYSEGWELVAVVPLPHDPGQGVFYFKHRQL